MFLEQRVHGHAADLGSSRTPCSAVPKLFNLRTDPYERADITSNTYYDWMLDRVFVFIAGAGLRRRTC